MEVAGIVNDAEDEVWETLKESRKLMNVSRECEALDRATRYGEVNGDDDK